MIKFSSKDEANLYFEKHFDEETNSHIRSLVALANTPNITEEVALYKLSIDNVVQLFGAALKSENTNAIDKASELLQTKLRAYAEMVRIQAQLDASMRDKITVDQLREIVNRIVDIVGIECQRRNQLELAEAIEEQVGEELNITLNPRGATIRPDMDVRGMIDSVPRVSLNAD